jgi:hypothetical protein
MLRWAGRSSQVSLGDGQTWRGRTLGRGWGAIANRCVLAGAGIDSTARQRLGAIVRGLVLGVSVGDYP